MKFNSTVKDLQRATAVAFSMVTQLGMSENFGSVDFHTEYSSLSSETKRKIEVEVRRLIDEGRQRVTKVLTERRRDLDLLANALVEYEVLNADEMRRVMKGEKLPKLTVLPNTPIKVPEFMALPSPPLGGPSPPLGGPSPPLGGSSPGGGGLGVNGGLGESGGLDAPGGPSRPDGSDGAKL